MKHLILFLLCMGLALSSCSPDVNVVTPQDDAGLILAETQPLTPTMRAALEGVYRVVEGQDMFGDLVALKWSGVASENLADTAHYLSGFFGRDVAYFNLQGGILDTVFFFSGTWRKLVNTETGLMRFVISSTGGSHRLFQPSPVIGRDSIILTGNWGEGSGSLGNRIVLKYERPLYRGRPFEILAHRAGGRTSDLLPTSENSVAMILLAERLGATGIEIDIHLTKDGIPILYHDSNINLRLTQPSGLVGSIEEYTYLQLQTFVRLIHGERIPTLQEALDAALYRTSVRTVWLDMKAVQHSMPLIRDIQQEYLRKAALAGRDFTPYIGLPTQEKFDEFAALPGHQQDSSLCELSVDQARQVNSRIWAPRFTAGTQNDLVAQMHAEGRRAFVWTLDEPGYVQQFIANGNFDGILSNYSSIVAYYHYVRQ
jgi:glycerophosphoryl diester phosphodiesterase